MSMQTNFLDQLDPLQEFQRGRAPSLPTGEQLKREGQERAAKGKSEALEHARRVARAIALNGDGTCDADRVDAALKAGGKPGLGNAAGMLFQSDEWVWTGAWLKSKRRQAHCNLLRVWRLKNGIA